MRYRQLYMKIDRAHAGIPVAIADTPTELARMCGVKLCVISNALRIGRENPKSKRCYVSVWTRRSESDYEKYFGRTTS